MSHLLPFTPDVDPAGTAEPRLVDIDDDAADEVFDALGSGTARTILAALHKEPRPASRLAEATDTSVQNVQYHLGKLSDVGLVEVADTWYSDRGREMKVYAPADKSLVVFAGTDRRGTFSALLRRLVGVVLLVGVAWAAVERLGEWLPFGTGGGGDGGAPGGAPDDGSTGGGDGPDAGTTAGGGEATTVADGAGGPEETSGGDGGHTATVSGGGDEATSPGAPTSAPGETVTEPAGTSADGTVATTTNTTGTTADPGGTTANASGAAVPPDAGAADLATGWDVLSGAVPTAVLLAAVAVLGTIVLVGAVWRWRRQEPEERRRERTDERGRDDTAGPRPDRDAAFATTR